MVSALTALQSSVSPGAVEELQDRAYVHVDQNRSGARCADTSVQFGKNCVVFMSHTQKEIDGKMSAELPLLGQHTAAWITKYWRLCMNTGVLLHLLQP